MSYIPSVRNEYDDNGSKNAYWEGHLDRMDKNYIAGYDAAVERIREIFTDPGLTDIDHTNINTEAVAAAAAGSEPTYEEERNLNAETLAVLGIRGNIADSLELWRNDIVVSMLENLDKLKNIKVSAIRLTGQMIYSFNKTAQ